MTLRNLMVIEAVIALGFGIALVLATGLLAPLYGLALDPGGILFGQLLGAELLGYSVLAWSVRNAVDSETRRAILLVFFVTHAVGFVVALLGQLSGLLNVLGWSIVGIYLLLAVGFGYFRFLSPSPSKQTEAA